jgi:hypothetical protein
METLRSQNHGKCKLCDKIWSSPGSRLQLKKQVTFMQVASTPGSSSPKFSRVDKGTLMSVAGACSWLWNIFRLV